MGRAPCCDKNGLKKGPWTPEEDQMLVDYVQKHGHGSWRTLPKNAGLERCGKSCRLRWTNYLRPDIKRGRFSFEEEETIIQIHSVLGNKWSAIAARLPGRTDNEIKNYWNTHIRKSLLRMGIDPVTHNRHFDLSDLSSLLTSQLHSSSQLNFSRLLGIHPLINSEILKLTTQNLLLQNLNDLGNSQFQDQTQIQPSLVDAFLNGTQLMQPPDNVDHQLQSNHVNCQEPQPNMWQGDIQASSITEHVASAPSYGYYDSSQSCIDNMLPGNSVFQSQETSDQKINSDSVLSTPSSSLTPLDSCSTYKSTTEDERYSFCSDILQYEIPDTFDMTAFM